MMFTLIALASTAIALDAAPEPLRVRADHAGTAVELVYQPSLALNAKDVGSTPTTRLGSARCDWSVDVNVARHVQPAGTTAILHRGFAATELLSGSRPGSCATNRAAIAREIAEKSGAIDAHVAALAESDRAVALNELASARSLAAN